MTIEVTQEAVEAALKAEALEVRSAERAMRAALEAALPFLAEAAWAEVLRTLQSARSWVHWAADHKDLSESDDRAEGYSLLADIDEAIAALSASPAPVQSEPELRRLAQQTKIDLDAAHAEICKLQSLDPATHKWPEWSSPAHTIAWCDEILSRPIHPSDKSLVAAELSAALDNFVVDIIENMDVSQAARDLTSRGWNVLLGRVNAAEAELARLKALPSEPSGVRVKELEWVERLPIRGIWDASSVLGSYRLDDAFQAQTTKGMKIVLPGWRSPFDLSSHECTSLDEAKAAAQSDYETRIRSALSLPSEAVTP